MWAARHHRNIHTLTTTKHLVQTTREESATGCVCVDGGGCSRHRGEWDVMKLKAEKFASGAAVMWLWQYVPTTLFSVMYLFALLEIKMLCEGTANKNISDVDECTVKNSNKNVSCLHLIIRKNKTGIFGNCKALLLKMLKLRVLDLFFHWNKCFCCYTESKVPKKGTGTKFQIPIPAVPVQNVNSTQP